MALECLWSPCLAPCVKLNVTSQWFLGSTQFDDQGVESFDCYALSENCVVLTQIAQFVEADGFYSWNCAFGSSSSENRSIGSIVDKLLVPRYKGVLQNVAKVKLWNVSSHLLRHNKDRFSRCRLNAM